jgi:hypothetical protein
LSHRVIGQLTQRTEVLSALLATALASIYVPSVGHGFVKDDFVWIARSHFESAADVSRLFQAPTGFFRPLVSISFALNRAVSGLDPLGYGLVNVALLFGCCLAIVLLAQALSFSWPSALFCAALWAFNFHGINAAVLWISGRTALLVTLFAVLGAAHFVRGRYGLASGFLFLAMLSKEEGLAIPGVLLVWSAIADRWEARPDRQNRRLAPSLVALSIPVLVYLLLRMSSGAFTPATAPPYYQLSFTADRLLSNFLAYADRSMTFSVATVLLLAGFATGRRRLRFFPADRSSILLGVLWLVGAFALTIFLPVRSSLYVCLPSVGVAVMATTFAAAIWREMPISRRPPTVVTGLILLFLLLPVYRGRNSRLVSEAELSRTTLTAIERAAPASRGRTLLVIKDDRAARPSLNDAFGTMLQDAVDLVISPRVRAWMVPPPTGADLAGIGPPPAADVALELKSGVVELVSDAAPPK